MTLKNEGNDQERIVLQIDPDLEVLIPKYLDNRRKDAEIIQEALNNKDFELIQRMGHTMKGSGGGYGFDYISAIGSALEEAAKDGGDEKIQDSLANLRDFLERVEVVYK